MSGCDQILAKARRWQTLNDREALRLADCEDTGALAAIAAEWRDAGFRNVVTYSRKVFLPLTPPMPRCVPLLHVRAGSPQAEGTLYVLGRGAGHRPSRRGARLQGSAVYPGRETRTPLQGGAGRARATGIRDNPRLPQPCRRQSPRRNGAAPTPESRQHDPGGTGPAAHGCAVHGHHAGVHLRAPLREGHAPSRLTGQGSRRAPANPRRRRQGTQYPSPPAF